MTMPLRVTVEPAQVTVPPGGTAEVEVTVQNAGQSVEHFATTVVGLPREDMVDCQPAVLKLRPGESGSTTVRLTLPERGGLDAGRYVLGMLVRSPYQGKVSRCEELRLDLTPAPALTMTAFPELSIGGPAASYALNLANEGNTVLNVGLDGRDQEAKVAFSFRPRSLVLDPGGRAQVEVAVQAPAPWTGQQVRRVLSVRASAGPDVSAERTLTFVQRPRVPAGPLRVVGIAGAVAVLAAATIGGALIRNAVQDNKSRSDHAAVATAPAAGAAAGAGGAGGAGASGGPGGSGQPGASGSGSPGPSGSALAPLSGKAKVVDFTQRPGGQPAGNAVIAGDLFTASGVTLSSVTEQAPKGCEDATAVALRTTNSLGSFLTSARPAGVDLCNTMPVRMTFGAPARGVRLAFAGAGATYRMVVELTDGTQVGVNGVAERGTISTVGYDAPSGGRSIAAVIFGHADPSPTAKDPTIIKRLTYTPA